MKCQKFHKPRQCNLISKEYAVFIAFFFLGLSLTFNIHNRNPVYTYKSEVWADKAGYYIYLPAWFIYNFNQSGFPENIAAKTGDGFSLDKIKGKIYTKYTCGVALMQVPFFLAAHLITLLVGGIPDGFSEIYQRMMNVGAVFWLVIGLWFLKLFLGRYLRKPVVYAALFILFFGTNLYNYALDETLMSHVYSFALVSVFLYLIKQLIDNRFGNNLRIVLSGLVFGIIVLIRPTNIILGLVIFFLDIRKLTELAERLRLLLSISKLLFFLIPSALVLLPQFIYWHYLSGQFMYYSYHDEGFSNWLSPRFLEVWFAPMNGLFLYSPVYLIVVAGGLFMCIKRQLNGWLTFLFFLISGYIFASWHQWDFGCSYGQRSFVDFLPVFAIGLGSFLQNILDQKKLFWKIAFLIACAYFSFFNIKMTYAYDECFYGEYWDWKEYNNLLDRSGVIIFKSHSYHFNNDFENPKKTKFVLFPAKRDSVDFARSGFFVSTSSHNSNPSSGFQGVLRRIGYRKIQSADIHANLFLPDSTSTGILVCAIDAADVRIFSKELAFNGSIFSQGNWQQIDFEVSMPETISQECVLKIYFQSLDSTTFFIDDLDVLFKY